MAIEVLLMEDVQDLGVQGDVVRVAVGFARNYLLPKKFAAPVSEATRRRLVKLQKDRVDREKTQLVAAQGLAGRMQNAAVTIRVKVSAEGKLYGSVTASDIAAALTEQGFAVERGQVQLEQPLKELGVYDLRILIHARIDAAIKVSVVRE